MISLIVCMGKNNEIGKSNDMPWGRDLPNDLAHFKKTTWGKTIVMGRKTYESIGRALPGRKNIVLTRDEAFERDGVLTKTIREVLSLDEELFVIGGSEIYNQFLPYAKRLYITKIHETFEADTYFPSFNEQEYELIHEEKGSCDEKNIYEHTFLLYEKNS